MGEIKLNSNQIFKSILLGFILISSTVIGQQDRPQQIDSVLFQVIPALDKVGKYKKALELGKKMKQTSIAYNYPKGQAWANYCISNSLCNLEKYKESSEFLKLANSQNTILKDPDLEIAILLGRGRKYNEEKLSYSLAAKEFRMALNKTNALKNPSSRNKWNFVIYKNLTSVYYNLSENDSAYHYAHKANAIQSDAYVLTSLTHYHLENSYNKDSVLSYLNKSDQYFLLHPEKKFEKTIAENQWSKYFLKNKNPQKALEHSLSAEKLARNVASSNELLLSYQNTGTAYKALGKDEEADIYFKKETKLKDSLNTNLIKNLNHSVLDIVEYENNKKQENINYLKKIGMITLIALIFIFLLWLLQVKKLKNKITSAEDKIQEKKEEIHKIEEILQSRDEVAFQQLLEMAKQNSPNFYLKFLELHPYFQPYLLSISPELSSSDLIFSAYIYLGFTSKEIADYTFRSVKTIQNRKNSLRKKLLIDSDQDLYIWFTKIPN